MRRLVLAVIGLVVLVPSMKAESGLQRVEVVGDRVCLRAAPRDRGEVVCQVSASDTLVVSEVGEEWVAVVPPATAAVYVAASFVSNGVVRGDGVYVRSGPGVNYSPLGYVQRGYRVEARRSEGGWMQIAPSPGIRVWIHRQFVSLPYAGGAQGQVVQTNGPTVVQAAPVAVTPKPWVDVVGSVEVQSNRAGGSSVEVGASLRSLDPVVVMPPSEGGGALESAAVDPSRYVPVYSGRMDRCSWAIRRPADYRVVGQDSRGRPVTVCFVVGKSDVIEGFLGKTVTVSGIPLGMHDRRTPIVSAGNVAVVAE